MKKLQVITGFCIVLFLVLTSVSAIKKLSTFDSLKQMNFGQSVPEHSLLLLYWFANTIDIDNNDLIRLTFDPNRGDYGSHHYGNYERVLEPLPHGNVRYRYYTVGNLNQEMSSQLPSYVIHPRVGFEGRNRDRIIFRVREQNVGRQGRPIIDQVYITQHYQQADNQGTRYDPEHTYQITPNLLIQIREFSDENYRGLMEDLRELRDNYESHADENQLNYIKNTWGELACLGLFLYIVIHEKPSSCQPSKKQQPPVREKKTSEFVVNIPARTRSNISGNSARLNLADWRVTMTLQVKTSACGTAMIHWSNIPQNHLKEGVMIALYKSDDDDDKALFHKFIENQKSGSFDTKISLNEQLQARLHKTQTLCFFWKHLGEEIDRGDEFKNPEAVHIHGNEAKLQLFVKNGKACARLYVSKYVDWKSTFKKSWVGFYSSETENTHNYKWWQWQWVTKFKPMMNFQDFTYDIFEYQSSLTIAPGVQARLMLHDYEEKARTPGWK